MTSATTPKTVDLGGGCIRREAVAGGTITPGMLLGFSGGEVVAHAVADGPAQPAFALEYDLTGRGISDNYADGDQVLYGVFPEGARVYAILASGQNVGVDALLASAGDGRLKAATTGDNVIARALEAVNASGGAARIRVEVTRGFGI